MSKYNRLLSEEEVEMMHFIAYCPQASSKEIADNFYLSESSIKSKLSKIYSKMQLSGANKRTAALIYCISNQLIPFIMFQERSMLEEQMNGKKCVR